MKRNEIKIGTTYRVKVSGTVQDIRITRENPRGGWDGVNVATKRAVRIKGAQRVRGPSVPEGAIASVITGLVFSARADGTMRPVLVDHLEGGKYHTTDMLDGKVRMLTRGDLRGSGQPLADWKARQPGPPLGASDQAALETAAKVASKVLGVPVGVMGPAKAADVGPGAKKSGRPSHEAAGAGKRATGEPGASSRRPSGLDAAAQVLADAGKPLNAQEMVQRMLAKGLWNTTGKTPSATIYAAIIREIAAKGGEARFRKTERGKFELAK